MSDRFYLFLLFDANLTMSPLAAEIAMLDGYIVVYKFIQDLHFFVTGGEDENELIIATVLQGFFDAVGILLRSFDLLLSLFLYH